MRRGLAALMFLASPASVGAQPVVVSEGAEAVSVTVYRSLRGDLEPEWPEGYALITETRTVDLPAGPVELRFEGVSGGIVPVSAIVTGLPGGVAEKNRDARLLSPGGLIDATLGKRVRIRRTSRATGKVTETEAIVRSGPDGVILQTPAGIEALRCSGLPEALIHDSLPEGLSDKPTLAVRTESASAARATLRLSYLSTGFDWRANYVVNMAPDGRTLDLFAWLTLANGNDESFAAAQTQAIAGDLNREEDEELAEDRVPATLELNCWPAGTTGDVPLAPPVPVSAISEEEMEAGGDIVVTGSLAREALLSSPNAVMVAGQEELGDLKLYRVPEPVTVAANAQKQVALLTRSGVRFERLYGASLNATYEVEPEPVSILLRLKNEKKQGLGLPLPAGTAAVFEAVGGRPMLAGEVGIEDTAVGQEIDLRIGEAPDVTVLNRELRAPEGQDSDHVERHEVEVANASPRPVVVETLLRLFEGWKLEKPSKKLGVRNGRHVWRVKVPANGRAKLHYTARRTPPREEEDEE